jgi:phenylpropionate dioxygenase-like ring-hydroxylating dioxygenase large terminal subunit
MAAAFTLSEPQAQSLLAEIEAGSALPTQWYGDPAIYEAELARIHRRSWHFATQTGELAETGATAIREVAGVPIALVRGEDGAIRGFLNICRHRGHPVVLEAGCKKMLQCHYHGWAYRLDGSLRGAPRSADDPTFDPSKLGLIPVQTHVWGPMVWVNLDVNAPSFAEWIAGMPELVAERGLDVTKHEVAFAHEWEMDANWKVFQDNTIECYHCPTTHPELSRALDMRPEGQVFSVGGRYWIHHKIPFRKGVPAGISWGPVEGRPYDYYYHWVFPTTYMQFAGRGFDIGSVDVVGVDKIRFRHLCFLPPDTPAEIKEKGQRQLEADATIRQDVDICNRVQKGHKTGLAPTGRLLGEPEHLLRHLQRLIVEMMAGRV